MVQCQPMLWSKSNSSALSPIPFNIFIFGLDDRVKSVLISYVNDIKLGGPLCSPTDKIVTFRNRELEETTRNNEILFQNPNYASRKPGITSFLTVSQTNSWSCSTTPATQSLFKIILINWEISLENITLQFNRVWSQGFLWSPVCCHST